MKNNSHNKMTNSRVGRIWSKETSNEMENEVYNKSIMSSEERTNLDPNY